MAYPKEIRNQLGLSMAEFANLIECNPGQLSMAESGNRYLPSASTAVAALLETTLAQTNGLPFVAAPADEDTLKMLNREIRTTEVKLNTLLVTQEKLAKKIQQLQRLQQVATAISGSKLLTETGIGRLQLQLLQRKAGQKIKLLNFQLSKLQISVAGLQAVIKVAKELKDGQVI